MLTIALKNSSGLFFNKDCITGCRELIPDNSVDLIVTDPPYGIAGETLHKHYHRNEARVIGGYVDVPKERYAQFSMDWIAEAERILRPGGSLYVVSGYTNLIHILNALSATALTEVNHLIWKYNFGVYTSKKFISSHYHILYYVKKGKPPTFNTFSRFGQREKDTKNGSLNYLDREDVWIINREYKPNRTKNKNELPSALLTKIIQYSSNEQDVVCDFFLGSFSTARIAIGLNRTAIGFEINKQSFDHHVQQVKLIEPGSLLKQLRAPDKSTFRNQGKAWTKKEIAGVLRRFRHLRKNKMTKKNALAVISAEYERGPFSVLNIIDKHLP